MGDKSDIEIKQAFLRVKDDIFLIKNHLKELENKIKDQTKENEGLFKKINEIYEIIKGTKDSSTGNEGVKQSINQSIIKQSINQSSTSEPINGNNSVYNKELGNEGVNQSIIKQSINQTQDREEQIKKVTHKLNTAFLTLSKQELKLFLTIYQLEDEGIIPTYKNISQKMQLSESCLRAHLSSLLRKNIPLQKIHFNNRIVQVSVSKEFKVLNLKQRLINLYYESDPHQKTLFDTII